MAALLLTLLLKGLKTEAQTSVNLPGHSIVRGLWSRRGLASDPPALTGLCAASEASRAQSDPRRQAQPQLHGESGSWVFKKFGKQKPEVCGWVSEIRDARQRGTGAWGLGQEPGQEFLISALAPGCGGAPVELRPGRRVVKVR